MKPEEKTELILWDWLKTKGKDINEVHFNRINTLFWKTFNTSGINKKPDFIIEIDRGYGKEYIALEIKETSSSRNIHDSGKILMYYENYISGVTKYLINEQEIKINHFAIASENSLRGYLFQEDKEIISNGTSTDFQRKTNSQLKLIPQFEYQRTSDFLRRLWSEWRNLKQRMNIQTKQLPSIGIIISNPTINDYPYLMTMIYIDWLNKNGRWGQRFWRL